MADERCPLTDLLPDQCGCKNHRNISPIKLNYGNLFVGPVLEARFEGRCVTDPSHAIEVGDEISLATHDGITPVGWVCARCASEIVRG